MRDRAQQGVTWLGHMKITSAAPHPIFTAFPYHSIPTKQALQRPGWAPSCLHTSAQAVPLAFPSFWVWAHRGALSGPGTHGLPYAFHIRVGFPATFWVN